MRKKMAEKHGKKREELYRSLIELTLIGCITGVFSGAIVTAFNILAHKGEEFSRNVYAFIRNNPAFLPVLLLALVAGSFLLSVLVNVSSVIRGCGIPQAEGGTRGLLRFRWYRDLVAMFAASLLSIFMGLSIGSEGPSVLIGACAGDGIASLTHRNKMIRKYQITGGACTGLAVASNAPLTGMAFAFEEAHKRFTPEVFICAFSSVIFGVLTRSGLYALLGMEIQSSFHSYVFHELPIADYGYVLLAGLICGLAGVIFYKICFKVRKWFGKIRCKNEKHTHAARIFIAVLLGGLVSLLATGAMGGGHDLIESLGTLGGIKEASVETMLGMGIFGSLCVIFALKFFITGVNVGSGIPCGIFIPIIAMGACLGGALNEIWLKIGMDARYCDLMIMICMAAFFTTIIKAPITSIVMICEFTGSFAPLLPVIIAVFIGYLLGEMSRTEGIYEELLEIYEKENGINVCVKKEVFTIGVAIGAIADKREVRDVLWPEGARITELMRGDECIVPNGDTVLRGGDTLTIVCKTADTKGAYEELLHILG